MAPMWNLEHALKLQQLKEEVANSATHAVGLGLSLAGAAGLLMQSALWNDPTRLVSCLVYGITLVALYAGSTVYHSVQDERCKEFFWLVDHSCIYLLIAGTYTPFSLTLLRPYGGEWLLAAEWLLAGLGIAFKTIYGKRYPHLSTTVYVAMGWAAIVAIGPMLHGVPSGGLAWLLAGGVAYTAGVYYFVRDEVPFSHAIWHLFVLAGSLCHYAAVVFYVVPA